MINRLVNNQRLTTAVFAALADPTRRRLLVRLSGGGESQVAALARPFRISPPAISRHLRVLEKARLIQRRRQGRVHLIRARPDGLREAQKWINQYAAGWEFSFDALANLLGNQQPKEEKP
jgi:DNA-binding transcriptional ArsR family regulator